MSGIVSRNSRTRQGIFPYPKDKNPIAAPYQNSYVWNGLIPTSPRWRWERKVDKVLCLWKEIFCNFLKPFKKTIAISIYNRKINCIDRNYALGDINWYEFAKADTACVVGVTGADMKRHIQTIMTRGIGGKLSLVKKLIPAMTGAAALAFPIIVGLLNAPSGQAQSQTGAKPSFDVISIKIAENCGNVAPGVKAKIPGGIKYEAGGRFTSCGQLQYLITDAYNVELFSPMTGVPDWGKDILYKIEAKAEGDPDKEQMRLMVQSLLEDKFKLRMHRETQETPVYLLIVAKGGHKLQQSKDEKGNPMVSLPPPKPNPERMVAGMRKNYSSMEEMIGSIPPGSYSIMMDRAGHQLNGKAMSMDMLAKALYSNVGGRKVIDRTGLTGLYDIQLTYANPFSQQAPAGAEIPAAPSTPSIFNALQQQLGLKLEEGKAPMDHYIIDSAEKPPEN